jgi:hypothetical protein
MYLCRLIMQKFIQIITLTLALSATACRHIPLQMGDGAANDVVAKVDDKTLRSSDIMRDMPKDLSSVDSVTFAKMYVENWVLNQLKMRRADEVLSSHQADVERLVEGYRQSLIMRQLDQYYIDNTIDLEITDKQLSVYDRANSASFKLDHNKVRGVVVKAPLSFRNTSTLTATLKSVLKSGDTEELRAFTEKLNLGLSDCSQMWVSYSDFLSNLPTERSRSYTDLLSKSGVQQMKSDDAIFYFVIIDVARKGEVAPLECVEDDIRRRLYAERRADIVKQYETELKRESVLNGRVTMADSVLMESMSFMPAEVESVEVIDVTEEQIEEDIPTISMAPKNE